MSGARSVRERRVLMILYFFPPLGGVAMARNISNVIHLRSHGWRPVVLTPRNPAAEPRDEGALALVPDDVEVVRTASVEAGHLRQLFVRLRGLARARRPTQRRAPNGPAEVPSGDPARDVVARPAVPGPEGLGLTGIRRRLFFPDDQVGWLPFAVLAATRAHRASGFDVVFSTSSPITSHLVAGLVKRLVRVPWVAEFRDPWLGNTLAPSSNRLYLAMQRRIERWIVHTADTVVCVTPSLTRLYQERYPNVKEMVTIPNGYNRAEIGNVPRRTRRSKRFELVYAGTVDRPAELRIFLEGLDRLIERRPELLARLDVAFFGTVGSACRDVVRQMVDGRRLGQVVRFEGFVPRLQALAAVAGADAALVLLGSGPGMDLFVGGKTYEYIGQDKQILAMLPPGDARDVLERLDWGIVANPEPADVEQAIERLLGATPPTRRADPEGLFDRAILAGRLAECLGGASSSARPRRSGRRRLGR
jgi:glycosyltransferase involved in cell wall biosynthesis